MNTLLEILGAFLFAGLIVALIAKMLTPQSGDGNPPPPRGWGRGE